MKPWVGEVLKAIVVAAASSLATAAMGKLLEPKPAPPAPERRLRKRLR